MSQGEEFRAQIAEAENKFLRERDLGTGGECASMTYSDTMLLLEHSLDFFEWFFLGDTLDVCVPEFHRENWPLMTNPPKHNVALAWPRGYAKSTLAKLAGLHTWLFNPSFHFTTYTSSSRPIAVADCHDMIQMVLGDNAIQVFGDPKFSVRQESYGQYVFSWHVPGKDGILAPKDCILKAYGVTQQIRGTLIMNYRPQFGIEDDIEDNINVSTPEQQNAVISWFYGPYLKAFDRRTYRHLYLGNMLSNNSLLYDLTENSPMWIGRRFGCLTPEGKPLWPENQSFEDIQLEFMEHRRLGKLASWYCEMMNTPVAAESSVITADAIKYVHDVSLYDIQICFITVDPAISKKKRSDDRAISVHALVQGKWCTIDYMAGKFTPEQLFFNIITLCRKWHTRVVGIELAGFQIVLETLFRIYMAKYRQHFNIIPIEHHNIPKSTRIGAWCSLLRTGEWFLSDNSVAIVNQLVNYDPRKENNIDDIIDSCAMAVTMTKEHIDEITAKYGDVNVDIAEPENEYQISPV